MDTARVLAEVRSALHSEPRFTHREGVELAFDNGTLTIEGEVQSIADAWYVFGVDRVENRLDVHPGKPTGAA